MNIINIRDVEPEKNVDTLCRAVSSWYVRRDSKFYDIENLTTKLSKIDVQRACMHRIEEVIEPDSLICPCGCGVMHRIGEDRSERLDIVPAQLRVIVTVRPKYACRTCTDGVTQAPAPSHLIMGGAAD